VKALAREPPGVAGLRLKQPRSAGWLLHLAEQAPAGAEAHSRNASISALSSRATRANGKPRAGSIRDAAERLPHPAGADRRGRRARLAV
jgi:hypothetical protein